MVFFWGAGDGRSQHQDADSLHKAGDSPYKNEKLGPDAGRPEDEWEQLRTIAAAFPKKRRSPQETERLILKLCRGRWLSRNQLAELLGRNPEGVRARFLVPMVEHGLLRLRYPDKPNRADQAYTAGDGQT
jgi:ATP-dependent DNA helicase RecG